MLKKWHDHFKFNFDFKKIISNSMWLFTDKVLRLFMGLFVGAWVARYLGPENYGLFSYAAAFVAVFSTIITFGIDGLVVRELSKSNKADDIDCILGTAFWLRFLGGIISVLICSACAYWVEGKEFTTTFIIIVAISIGNIFQSFDTISLLYQAQVNSKNTVKAKFFAFIFTSIIKVLAILSGSTVLMFALISTIEVVLGAMGLLFVYKRNILRFPISYSLTINFIKMSWPILLSMICIVVYMKLDQLLLGKFLGEEKLGIYSVATRISDICYFIPNVLIASVTPYLVKYHETDKIAYKEKIQQFFNYLVLVSYLVITVVVVLSQNVIDFLYGAQYSHSVMVLQAHIWSLVFVSLGVGFRQLMIIEGKMIFLLLTTILGAVSSVIINVILIPIYGFYGAVAAVVFSQLFAGYLSTLLYKETRGIFYIQTRALFLLDFFAKLKKRGV